MRHDSYDKKTATTIEQPSALRQEVQSAAITAARITGWAALGRPALLAKFRDQAPRSTLYRWLKEIDGAPLERTTTEMIRDARRGGHAEVESVAGEIQVRAAARFPRVPSLEACVAAVTPAHVIEKLHKCLAAGDAVIEKSRGAAGEVRNRKMLLAAAEQLRRSLETAVKLQGIIADSLEVEKFHQAILDEIAKIEPEVARHIVAWAGRYLGYQDKVNAGLLEHKVTCLQTGNRCDRMVEQVRVTPKGRSRLAAAFAKRQMLPLAPSTRGTRGVQI